MDNVGGDQQGRNSEEWRDAIGYVGRYEVSNIGRVRIAPRVIHRSRDGGRGLTQRRTGKLLKVTVVGGSRRVQVLRPGASERDRRAVSVGRLVYEAFVAPLAPGERVVRRDGSLGDFPENLQVLSPTSPATTYKATHTRISTLWGAASAYRCVNCDGDAEEWSYDGTDPTHLFDLVAGSDSHCHFSLWPEFYAPMCRACHRTRDQAAAADELREYREWKMRNPGKTFTDLEVAA